METYSPSICRSGPAAFQLHVSSPSHAKLVLRQIRGSCWPLWMSARFKPARYLFGWTWEAGRGREAPGVLTTPNRQMPAFEALAFAAMGHTTLTDKNVKDLIGRLREYLRNIIWPLTSEW